MQPGMAANPFAPGGQMPAPQMGGGMCGGAQPAVGGQNASPTGPILGKGSELRKLYNMPDTMGHNDGINCMITAEGKIYSGGRDSQLFLWRGQPSASSSVELVQDCAPINITSNVNALYFDSASQWLFAGLWGGQIQGWCKAPVVTDVLSGHRKSVSCLTMHSGVLISGSNDATVRLWTLNQQAGRFQAHGNPIDCPGGMVTSVKVLNDGLWVGHQQGVTCIDLGSLQPRGTIASQHPVTAMLPYEGHMFVAYRNGDVCIFGPTGDQVYKHPAQGEHTSNTALELMVHPIAQKPMLLCGQQFGYVTAYDLPDFRPRGSFVCRNGSDVRAIVDLKADGLFVVGGARGDISLWQWGQPGPAGPAGPGAVAGQNPFAPSQGCGGGMCPCGGNPFGGGGMM
mmetsp:Transcript_33886/g.79238  ORF Transcript_33886/g.79238 Transcript_33886/m.79238 type:complete len:397 (-) Transcript_33886:174-1364(-)